MTVRSRTAKLLIGAMAKHLPPSASTLHLLDVDGAAGDILSEGRSDIQSVTVLGDPSTWQLESESFDAVVAYNHEHNQAFLNAALSALRPGGRLIMVDANDEPVTDQVNILENAGYTRILVETGIECPLPIGALMRGEKPHQSDDTLERVKVASDRDADAINWDTYNGRYVYLLIQQTPNKPAWRLMPDDVIEWKAAALQTVTRVTALVFSSLPKAVSFMQPAVLDGQLEGITKVAKFSREIAQGWAFGTALNPTNAIFDGKTVTWIEIDPASAEVPDE